MPSLSALGPIEDGTSYPVDLFIAMTGQTRSALRAARRTGLRVLKIGKRNFVLGRDWNRFLEQHGEAVPGHATGAV